MPRRSPTLALGQRARSRREAQRNPVGRARLPGRRVGFRVWVQSAAARRAPWGGRANPPPPTAAPGAARPQALPGPASHKAHPLRRGAPRESPQVNLQVRRDDGVLRRVHDIWATLGAVGLCAEMHLGCLGELGSQPPPETGDHFAAREQETCTRRSARTRVPSTRKAHDLAAPPNQYVRQLAIFSTHADLVAHETHGERQRAVGPKPLRFELATTQADRKR